IAPPLLQLSQPGICRTLVVGDVVDRPAKRVNLEHRLALAVGHDAHGRVKRAAMSALGSAWLCVRDFNGLADHRFPNAAVRAGPGAKRRRPRPRITAVINVDAKAGLLR